MSGEAQLEALLEIVTISTRQAIAEYKKSGNDVPTIRSQTYHPLDLTTNTVALKKAVRLLEGACQQLCASLAPPEHTLNSYAMSFEWACLNVVQRAKVADALEKFPDGLHVDELAKLVNLEKAKLSRVLRLLVIKGCFTEVSPNVFANNRISLVTLSSSHAGALTRIATEDGCKGGAVLYDTMTEPEYATSYEPGKAPLIYALQKSGFNGNFFDWVTQDAERLETYDRAMIGLGRVTGSLSILHHYPWKEVNTVCDVGAGVGAISIPLAKTFPHLKIVDQDLLQVLDHAKDVWAEDAPEALHNNQITFVPFNFFEESPVPGQDVYYLRKIIHDWPDAEAAVILKNVVNAMAPHSRLLIDDYVLLPASNDSKVNYFCADVAPEPLLPNFGNGNNQMYQEDIIMWLFHNGKERMLDDLSVLALKVGLQLDNVYDLGKTTVLEFRLAA